MQSKNYFNGPFSFKQRLEAIERIKNPDMLFDVAVIGGGITGAAVARDASLRGLNVLLVEKNDFAYGTSSRSSRLIHGGVRYLEQFEFKLVHESTRERAKLWQNSPELVKPMPFLFPSYKGGDFPLWKLDVGLWLYDILALFRSPGRHKKLSSRETQAKEKNLRAKNLSGSIFYWDAFSNDAKLTLANIVDAYEQNATTVSRCKLENVEIKAGQHKLELVDELSQEKLSAKAKSIVVATGPWTDHVLNGVFKRNKSQLMAPSRGSHIVIPMDKIQIEHAIVLSHPEDKRVMFAIPWGDFCIVGTTDIFDSKDAGETIISAEECDYILEALNYFFPDCKINKEDVISTWSGIRPLVKSDPTANASELSRDHYLEWKEEGVLTITGGKLTTHREMAKDAVDTLFFKTRKWSEPLNFVEAECLTLNRPLTKFKETGKEAKQAIGKSEGARMSLKELAHIIETEMVLTIEDLLVRRTDIFYKEKNNGLDLLPKIKECFCKSLELSEEDWVQQKHDYQDYVTKQLAFKAPKDD